MLGVWGVMEHSRSGNGGALFIGIGGFAAAVVLVVYGLWIGALCVTGLACFYLWPTQVPPLALDVYGFPGGQTFLAGSQVDSRLNFDVTKVNYQYSLFHNEEAELGASIGLHVMGVSASINGTTQSQGQSITAPLPVWGLYAKYKFTPRFSAYYNYEIFNINYQDKVSGGLQDFLFGLEYRLFRNFALGAAYNRFALHMKGKGDATTVNLDTNWNGGTPLK